MLGNDCFGSFSTVASLAARPAMSADADVRLGSEADIAARFGHIRHTPRAEKLRGSLFVRFVPIADIGSHKSALFALNGRS